MLPFINISRATEAFTNASPEQRHRFLLELAFVCTTILLIILIIFMLIRSPHQNPAGAPSPAPSPLSSLSKVSSFSSFNSSDPLCILEITINRTLKPVKISQDKISGNLMTLKGLNSQEMNALNDCLEMLDQTHYELKQTVQELQGFQEISSSSLGGFDSRFYSEIKTLLSAAMTNENTCIEGISDVEETDPENQKGLKDYLQDLLTPISHKISNCLAMVKHLENKKKMEHQHYMISKKIVMKKQDDDFLAWMTAGDRKMMQVVALDIRHNFVVASDGSGDFRTIGEAVKMAPNRSMKRVFIKIKAGVYEENVEIPREKMNIMLAGEGMDSTVITSNKNFFDGFSTFNSATLTVIGDRFLARDLTVINTSGPQKRQAVALRVTSNSAFYRCNFSSYQDTLYAHSLRQFYRECTIQGTIDFIFGNAAAVFQNCLILVRKPNPGQKNMITAQGREDPNQNTGISLQNCTIVAAPDLMEAGTNNVPTFLGRPWRNYSRTIVMKSYLGDLIHPQGWHKWSKYTSLDTVEYIEYMNVGPGSDTTSRVTWGGYKKNCSEEIAKQFTVGMFLHGSDYWLESTGFPFSYDS